MPQDAFTLLHVSKELNGILTGAKVNRVSQPDKDDVYLATYTKVGVKTLVLSTNAEYCRVSFTSTEKPNPKTAPTFCMLMRKHLLGAEITDVSLVGFERIIKISFRTRNDFKDSVEKILYCEIMGKYSNLILTENGKILGCLKNAPLDVATTRVTLSGAKYELPKSQDKADVTDRDEIKKRYEAILADNSANTANFLFNHVKGLSFQTADEIAARIGVNNSFNELYSTLYNFYLSPKIVPNVKGEGKNRDFYVTEYSTIALKLTQFDCILDAVDDVFGKKERDKAFNAHYKRLNDKISTLIKKLGKKLQGESEKLLAASDYDQLRIKGEILTANLYRVKKGEKEVTLENYYDDLNPIKINLDVNLTPNENAQRYFKKYAKEKRAIEIVTPQKEQTERELSYLDSILFELSQTTNESDFADIEDELTAEGLLPVPKKKAPKKPETPYREYLIEGYVVKCGKNNVQNDRLLSRAFKEDRWLHAKSFHSPFVIIETKGESIPDSVIEKAAEICAYYSDAGKGGKVSIDYTQKKNVKKPPKAKPGSVIYNDYETCLVEPDPHDEILK